MSETNLPKANFDTPFQRGILKLALNDDFFATQLVRYIGPKDDTGRRNEASKINVFNTPQMVIIFDCICKAMAKYKTRPSDAHIRQYISEFAPAEQDLLLKTYEDIVNEDTHDEAYFKTHLKAFIQQVKLAVGFYNIREKWLVNTLATPDVMQGVIDDFRRVEFEQEDIVTAKDTRKIMSGSSNFLKRLIPTGIAPLDQAMLGGLPRETFVAILGGTNSGKSMFCISLGASAVRAGFKVLHIALEGMRGETPGRYMANLADVPYKQLMMEQLSSEQERRVLEVEEKVDNYKVYNLLSFGMAVEDVIAKCREIYKDFKFDMLIVDYAQILTSRVKSDNAFDTQEYIHQALTGVARELDCVFITPVQATRDAIKQQNSFKQNKSNELSDAPILQSNDMSGCIGIARAAGVILTINRTNDEIRRGWYRLFVEKQRMEQKGMIFGIKASFPTCNLVSNDLYDPLQQSGDAAIEDDGLQEDKYKSAGNKMLKAIEYREQNDNENLRKRISSLELSLRVEQGNVQTLMKTASLADKSMSEEDMNKLREQILAKESIINGIKEEMRPLLKMKYPNATPDLLKQSKDSLKDFEKEGTAPRAMIDQQKEVVRHLTILLDNSRNPNLN